MVYKLANGKTVKIPDEDIAKNVKALGITKDEAVQLWLEDEGFQVNAVVEELSAKAKENKVKIGARQREYPSNRKSRPKDATKQGLIKALVEKLGEIKGISDITVVNDTKLITFIFGEGNYKLDLIKTKKPKD